MPTHRAKLELQELGDRALPSAAPLWPTDPLPPVVAHASHPLHGAGTGTYTEPAAIPDAGTSLALRGAAHLGGLGDFRVAGHVRGVGMIAGGRATGELVLSGAHGAVTLALHGPVQPAFGALPRELVYSVVGGTGDYAHLSGYGTVGIALTPAPVAPGHAPAGRFALTFS